MAAGILALLDGVYIRTPRARAIEATATVAETKRDAERGKLIPRAEVVEAWDAEHVRLRTAFEGLPEQARLEPFQDADDAIEWFEGRIRDVLLTLAHEAPGCPAREGA